MPNVISSELNRNISTEWELAEFGAGGFRFIAFTRTVTNRKGIQITGFDATLVNASAAPDTNGSMNIMITDVPVNSLELISIINRRRVGIVSYLAPTGQRITEITRRFENPIKLISGRTYSVLFVYDNAAVPTQTPLAFLTVFGYEEEEILAPTYYAQPR